MRGWWQYGYDRFPSGELRRRFFRQRDDPCGSEDDNDYDDETNDRPVYYYPLRRSEEGSPTPASTCTPSEEENDRMIEASAAPAAVPLYAHTTAYECSPAFYGASVVELQGGCRKGPTGRAVPREEDKTRYMLWHGGVSMVEPHVSDGFTLARLVPTSSSGASSFATAPFPAAVTHTIVPAKPSLEECLHTPLSHPALRGCRVEPERLYGDWNYAPPRFGHAAAPVELPPALACSLLTKGLPEPTRDEAGRIVCPPVEAFLSSSTPNKEDYELHLSVIIGGTEKLPSSLSAPSRSSRTVPVTYPFSPAAGSSAAGADTRVLSSTRSTTMSRPALCFTLLLKPGGDLGRDAGAAHWTRSFELSGSSKLPIEPRMFATLTPWPADGGGAEGDDGEDEHTLSFAYLGGTETGLAPAPLFPLTAIQLDYRSWQWSARVVPAFGAEPSPRFGHSTTYCDGNFLVFGGIGRNTCFLNDLHVLNARTRVWREVFVPIGIGLLPRAFHCAPLLLDFAREKVGVGGCGDFDDVAGYLKRQEERGTPAGDDVALAEERAETCVTERPTGARLMIVGGEGEDGMAEASVWLCSLDTAAWQTCYFPLLSQAQSYHVGAAAEEATETSRREGGGGGLSAHRLQETVRALAEREAASTQPRACEEPSYRTEGPGCLVADGFPASEAAAPEVRRFVSIVHGALAQAIALPASFGGGVLLLGGNRSPPVLLGTQLRLPHGSLKELAAFWLLSSRQSLPAILMRRAPSYYWHILGRTEFSNYVASIIRLGGHAEEEKAAAARPLPSLLQLATQSEVEAREEDARIFFLSSTMAETNRLVNQGALDEQLSLWMRSAKRRLREERVS